MKNLPNGWKETTLGEICEILDNQRIPLNSEQRNHRIADKNKDDLFPYYGATGEVGKIDDFIFDGEFVLLGEDAAPFFEPTKDVAYLVNGKFWVNNHAHILSSKIISNSYLCYYLNQFNYNGYVSGTTRLKLPQGAMKKIPIIYPTNKQTQTTITAKIEALFAEIDAGTASFQTALIQLAQYRQALLKQAFNGELSKKWREKSASGIVASETTSGINARPNATDETNVGRAFMPDNGATDKNNGATNSAADLLAQIQTARENHYQTQLNAWQSAVENWEASGKQGKKPTKPKAPAQAVKFEEGFADLPEGWGEICLAEITEISGGLTKNAKRKDFIEQVPYLRVANVYANELKLDEIEYIGIQETEKERTLLQKDDLLIVEGNGSLEHIGRVALWNEAITPCYHQNHLIKARCCDAIIPKFMLYFLMSPVGRKRIVNVASSTTGLHTLSLTKVANLIVPICPKAEQTFIIAELDRLLAAADRLEADLQSQLKQAALLKQSVLKAAFSGEL